MARRHEVEHERFVRESDTVGRPIYANPAAIVLGVLLALLIILLLVFGLGRPATKTQTPPRPATSAQPNGGAGGTTNNGGAGTNNGGGSAPAGGNTGGPNY